MPHSLAMEVRSLYGRRNRVPKAISASLEEEEAPDSHFQVLPREGGPTTATLRTPAGKEWATESFQCLLCNAVIRVDPGAVMQPHLVECPG